MDEVLIQASMASFPELVVGFFFGFTAIMFVSSCISIILIGIFSLAGNEPNSIDWDGPQWAF